LKEKLNTIIAVKMADYCDRLLKSDEAWMTKEGQLTPVRL
jgi:hypothetical protein